LSSIRSLELKLIEEKLRWWSSSLLNKLTFNNLRGSLITIGRLLEPKNIENKFLSLSSSVSSYIEDNPIVCVCSLPMRHNLGGGEIQTYVNLPYLQFHSIFSYFLVRQFYHGPTCFGEIDKHRRSQKTITSMRMTTAAIHIFARVQGRLRSKLQL